jgi:hypothetical protein
MYFLIVVYVSMVLYMVHIGKGEAFQRHWPVIDFLLCILSAWFIIPIRIYNLYIRPMLK